MKFIQFVIVLITLIAFTETRRIRRRGGCVGNTCNGHDCGSGAYCQTKNRGQDCECEAA